MRYTEEPPHRHGAPAYTGVLLVNLGTPDAPTPAAVRRYLAEFLSDPRVVEIPAVIWQPILHGVVLRTRPRASAQRYQSIWMEDGSPLAVWTQRQAAALQDRFTAAGHHVLVEIAMRYGSPSIAQGLDMLQRHGATRVLVLPLYPQYSAATTASAYDAVWAWAGRKRRVPELRFVGGYHDDAGYIGALANSVRAHWQAHGRSRVLLMSFHGMPERTLKLGDPYHCACHHTARLLADQLGLTAADYRVTFQSRFGRARWLEPATEPTLKTLAAEGVREVDVVCPGFAADCLETLEEIEQEARAAYLAAGGKQLRYIPCLNDDPAGMDALTALALRHMQGWDLSDRGALAGERALQRERALAMGAPD